MGSVQSNIAAAAGGRPAVYAAIELSKKSWLIALRGPAVDRISLHRLAVGDAAGLLTLIERFRRAAVEATGT
jgi:transposase